MCFSSSLKNSRWKFFHGRRATISSTTAHPVQSASATARPTKGHFRLCSSRGLVAIWPQTLRMLGMTSTYLMLKPSRSAIFTTTPSMIMKSVATMP